MAMGAQANTMPIFGLSSERLGGLLGILGVVCFVVGILVQGDVPRIDDPAEEIHAWFIDNGEQYLIGDFIIALGVVFGLVPFFIALRTALAAAPFWSLLALVGGLFFALVGAAASSFPGALAVGAEQIEDDSAVMALMNAGFYGFTAPGLVLGLFFVSTAMAIKQTGVFALALAWLCLALSVVGILSGFAAVEGDPRGVFSLLGLVALIGLGVVTLALGWSMLMRKDA